MSNLRAMLAMHVYGDVCGETVQSLVAELQIAQGVDWEVVYPANDALVSRLRSEVVTQAILGNYDVLVWLDHDMVWAPGDLGGLAKRCAQVEGVVGGLIPYRAEWMHGRGFPWRPMPGTKPEDVRLCADMLVPADKVGGGFVAFWVPALKRMVDELEKSPDPALKVSKCRSNSAGFFWDVCRPVAVPFNDGEGDLLCYQSEDWSLLMRLQACGVKVFAWTKPLLRHIGRKAFSAADALGLDGTYAEIEARLMALAMATGGQEGA
jgi:hypothetical protein